AGSRNHAGRSPPTPGAVGSGSSSFPLTSCARLSCP
ncbi:hypothetical protein A2U01_0096472, partial [Trifolium medium]|nr:hypothetical protein [Trifolium medium]